MEDSPVRWRRRALTEIESFRDDPDGLINKIDAAIDMLS